MTQSKIISDCQVLLGAYKAWELGYMRMPEDSCPSFSDMDNESRLAYFTLPMSLNYQRDSYRLWEWALQSFQDTEVKQIFDVKKSASMDTQELQKLLMRYKVSLQPNKHPATWQKISQTIAENWESIWGLLKFCEYDFLKLREIVQWRFKSGFPYLSGPKIFNYWSFIIQTYGKVTLKNSEFIEIAPDTHVTKCSVMLWVITAEESVLLSKEAISARWREILKNTNINPIDMHSPLWFWSRNDFQFKLPDRH